VRVWRICARRHARAAFRGEGARRYGGRWNLPGTAVVYAAESLSLAALELFVHLDPEDLPARFVSIGAEIPSRVSRQSLGPRDPPRGWRRYPPPLRLREVGTKWARAGRSAVLSVPSAVIPDERIYLLNPAHPHFARIRVLGPEPFTFDPRLLRR
jgi:RES domain-containing protein